MESLDKASASLGDPNNTKELIVCYSPVMITTNGVWQGDNPLDFSLPLFILQLTLVVVMTRLFVFLLKPFRQPRVISEILGGVVLGPSVLGRSQLFVDALFPLRSVMVLETMANIGLLYFLFLVGVEMDLSVIKQTGRRGVAIAVAGMILPFAVGTGFSFLLYKGNQELNRGTFILFIGVALSVTAFPVLARILAEVKLINSDIGRIALSSALINDMCAWILLAVAIALAKSEATSSMASLYVVFSSAFFVIFCIYLVRPAVARLIRLTPEGESFSESQLCVILTGVIVSGFITDAIGTHSIFGAFVFGLAIPNGPLGVSLIEKLEDFVSGLLLPLFFALSGLKTDVASIGGVLTWGIVLAVIVLACAGKIVGTLVVTRIYHMPYREGIALGFLMNTKGLVEMIILNLGKEQKVLNDKTFAIMVVTTVVMTAVITPVVTTIYQPMRRSSLYKKRTIEQTKRDGYLRLLVCIHTPRNVPRIINLLEASNPNKNSPICAYVLHLEELTGRASAMLIVHNTRRSGRPGMDRTQAQSDHIIHAFENFENHTRSVSIQPLTVISPYSTMHEDICHLAEDKRVAFIILPFHQQQTVDGVVEPTNPAFRTINRSVLANTPCSVGILVDKGSANEQYNRVAVLFFGGPDDREALAYASRMPGNPTTNLALMRFVSGQEQGRNQDIVQPAAQPPGHPEAVLTVETAPVNAEEKKLDDIAISEFRRRIGDDENVTYEEKTVGNGMETVGVIRSIKNLHELFIVGRGYGVVSPLTAGLSDRSEFPELGPIGGWMASSEFAARASVLVVQQYVGAELGEGDGEISTPYTPGDVNDLFDRHVSSSQRGEQRHQGQGDEHIVIP